MSFINVFIKIFYSQNTKNDERRERRLEVSRERVPQRIATENEAQRERHLRDLRQRAAQRLSNENDEQQEYRLEEQRTSR